MATTPPLPPFSRSFLLSSMPADPVLSRYLAAQLNPLVSPIAPQYTHELVHDLLCNVRSLASEFHERDGFKFLTTNPIYAMMKAAMEYEVRVEAEEMLDIIKYGPLE